MSNKISELLAVSLVKAHLLELNDYLNLTRGMTGAQIDQTAEMIIGEFPSLKIADMIYIFKQAKMGEFGPIYEGLDGAKILSWFRQVWSERLDYAEFNSSREHNDIKKDLYGLVGEQRTSGDCRNELKNLIKRAHGHFIQQDYEK